MLMQVRWMHRPIREQAHSHKFLIGPIQSGTGQLPRAIQTLLRRRWANTCLAPSPTRTMTASQMGR